MFEIALHIRREELKAAKPGQVSADSELDTVEAQLTAACELLADAEVANFRILCGGDRPWPVDVRTDLSVFLDQCVGLLQWLEEKTPSFRLEMYEQGIETALIFNRWGGMLQVRCEPLLSAGERRFCSQDENLDVPLLVRAIAAVVAAFVECCTRLCPQILVRPEMRNWREMIEQFVERLSRTEKE